MTGGNTGYEQHDLNEKLRGHWNASSKHRLFRQALAFGPFSCARQAAGAGRQLFPDGNTGGTQQRWQKTRLPCCAQLEFQASTHVRHPLVSPAQSCWGLTSYFPSLREHPLWRGLTNSSDSLGHQPCSVEFCEQTVGPVAMNEFVLNSAGKLKTCLMPLNCNDIFQSASRTFPIWLLSEWDVCC